MKLFADIQQDKFDWGLKTVKLLNVSRVVALKHTDISCRRYVQKRLIKMWKKFSGFRNEFFGLWIELSLILIDDRRNPAWEFIMGTHTLNTFITSSPRWLITFTAIRPDFGFSNGREVSLFSVAQASGSISAFKVVFSAL